MNIVKTGIIPTINNSNKKCYFCRETKSVKYTANIKTAINAKPLKVYVCNKCILHDVLKELKK